MRIIEVSKYISPTGSPLVKCKFQGEGGLVRFGYLGNLIYSVLFAKEYGNPVDVPLTPGFDNVQWLQGRQAEVRIRHRQHLGIIYPLYDVIRIVYDAH